MIKQGINAEVRVIRGMEITVFDYTFMLAASFFMGLITIPWVKAIRR